MNYFQFSADHQSSDPKSMQSAQRPEQQYNDWECKLKFEEENCSAKYIPTVSMENINYILLLFSFPSSIW